MTDTQLNTLREAHNHAEQAHEELTKALQPYFEKSPGLFTDDPTIMNFSEKCHAAIVLIALFE